MVTHDQAVDVLKALTSIHAEEEYFKKAEVVSVDMPVDGPTWRIADPEKRKVPPRVGKVPICVLVFG